MKTANTNPQNLMSDLYNSIMESRKLVGIILPDSENIIGAELTQNGVTVTVWNWDAAKYETLGEMSMRDFLVSVAVSWDR